jgi:hypothetical protein
MHYLRVAAVAAVAAVATCVLVLTGAGVASAAQTRSET